MILGKCLIFKESAKVPKVLNFGTLEVWRFGGLVWGCVVLWRIPPPSRSFKKAYPLQSGNFRNFPKLSCDINGLNVPFNH